jgi:hypothetical protein
LVDTVFDDFARRVDCEFGEYSQGMVARRFGDGSWSKSISELNYDSSELGIKISDDKLIKDVKIVSEK